MKKQLKKISGELKKASALHKGQAAKIDKLIKPKMSIIEGKMYSSCTEWLFDEKKSRKGQLWCSTRFKFNFFWRNFLKFFQC